ncbi:uncharacterized protein LOC579608 [Strongylocentrotus purpuratus]|uniref:Uncharacterized protein n=1 Tax=Strongylocentrotus purpuratus TaxID=7668 RepID=A0A7M7RGV1_STRPU|nr:uncharacterized protein LOC579608 [Strongylocentrotus purpuratus]|eukprot:XP_800047.3 PREDICTED: uncharacterized protein LOC579608 [Strongylocentrotus purpuratus]
MEFLFFVFLLLIGTLSTCLGSLSPSRLCVIENRVGTHRGMLAFRSVTPVAVQISYGNSEASSAGWSPWKTLGAPLASQPMSNPVCEHTDRNQTQIFVQASNGQVYSAVQDAVEFLKFSPWKKVGSNTIPVTEPKRSILVDSVSAYWYGKELMVFARSISSNASQLYWCKGNSTSFGSWSRLGGTAILGTDVTLMKNPYSTKYEAFMISPSGRMHRTWQHDAKSFADWTAMDFAPTFSTISRPDAEIMGYSIFNGKLMVGGVGEDNYIHRCSQSTCDGVDNPWGYCTWGSWYQTGGKIPFTLGGVQNNFAMSRNVHFGVEIFGVQDTTGQLWQAWQLDRDASWNTWSKIPQDLSKAAFINNPYITVNKGGWWMAYGLNASNQVVVMEPARSLNVTPDSVAWGTNLSVSWSVAVDEATNMDWVAIFPSGANDDEYVDYRYVQGTLNPGKYPVRAGNASMASYLPNGSYQVRYLVNKKYVSIVETYITYYNESQESDLLQLYQGIFTGLGAFNKGIGECVNDSLLTVEKFQAAFDAFENAQIYEGLQLLGTALQDVAYTLKECEEIYIAVQLESFIKDLVECTESDCTKFVVDLLEEIIILYVNEYEIYGDIKGASNSFNLLEAYQQGGLCIGRLVKACLGIVPPGKDYGRRKDVNKIGLEHLKWSKVDRV